MKHFTKTVVLTMLLLMSTAMVYAQTYVQVGSGTATGAWPAYYAPWGNYWENCHTQQLYLASELGGSMQINELAWEFERISSGNSLTNVSIKIFETTDNALAPGAFYSTSGATEVFSSASFIPATATGWQMIDIADYAYTGTNNLVIDVVWGDNGYWTSTYYRTFKETQGFTAGLIGYADSETPPNYDAATSDRDNMRFYYSPLTAPGDVEGYVMNGGGLSIAGATVGIEGVMITTSDNSGYYFLAGVPTSSGTIDMFGWKAGYNVVYYPGVAVGPGVLTYQDIILTSPTMFISPTFHEYTLNPEEYFTTQTGITNTGDGPLEWNAEVVYPTTDASTSYASIDITTRPQLSELPSTKSNGESTTLSPEGWKPLEILEGTDDLFACNPESVFGNTPVGNTNAYWSQEGGTYQNFQEIVGATGNWNTVTFWGVFTGGDPGVTENFIIEVYEAGSTPGALLGSYIADIESTNTGEILLGIYPIYQWITTIDMQTATDCWIKVASTDLGKTFYWLNSPSGTGNAQTWSGSSQIDSHEPLAICIESGGGTGSWLTLDYYSGVNPGFGYIENVPTNFDASGTQAGEVYTADLVFTSNPDVGTSTIPCTMIIAGDPLVPPTDLVVTLIDDINGVVELSWNWGTDAFQFFIIKRDGVAVGTSTTTGYIDNLPVGGYGEYCYTVQAYYDEGTTAPAGPECIEWSFPEIFIDPDFHEAWVWVDATYQWTTTINNLGIGSLQYTFPDYMTDLFECQHEVVMYDDFGDGWNGGTLTVYVDGVVVLNNITLSGGGGPESAYFIADGGQEITSTFVCGSWCYECNYEIIDGFGNIIATDGMGGVNPTGIPAGTCFANCPVPSFIVDVDPATGIIPEGGSEDILITWDATGFPPGDYYEDLLCESNDPINPQVNVGNLMHVYVPAQFAGTVTDCETGLAVSGATVTAGVWQTTTDNNGDYSLYVDAGTYIVYFDKLGFESVFVQDTSCLAGVITPIDVTMCQAPYPVPFVTATVNYPDEDYCTVDWALPEGPYELLYDDGSAEDLFAWSTPLNENAVKFTPAGYPATVFGGRVYVGDGLWPAGNWLSSEFAILVYDDDGANGMPGTVLDSVPVVVTNYGWIEFSLTGTAVFDDGEFYLSMMQLTYSPDCAPIGIDEETPTAYRSYQKFGGLEWSTSIYQDFMLRAYIDGPQTDAITDEGSLVYPPKVPAGVDVDKIFTTMNNTAYVTLPGTVKSGSIKAVEGYDNATDDVVYYTVARMSDFDPDMGPEFGTMTILNNVTDVTYQDAAWSGLAMGWYAYAVSVTYSNGLTSPWVFSNIVGRDMDVAVTFEITLCDGNVPEDVEITMKGLDYPYTTFTGVTDVTGIYTFEQIWKGNYDITVFKIGYESYVFDALIMSDETFEIILSEKKYPPRNLWVDPLTSFAYWDAPLVVAAEEDFEGVFPPEGWQSLTASCGWFQTDDGSSGAWSVPAWNSLYACANDDDCGSDADGSVDYLITAPLDLREVDTYHLMFDSYYDGAFGQMAMVEYSYDAGTTWDVLYALTPMAGSWDYVDVDLGSLSGMTAAAPVWIAFHADDGGQWASGWAIDNVLIANGETNPDGYHVYLDGSFVVQTDTTFHQYIGLTYGTTYTASVAAVYSCGLSEEIYYTFTSGYLYPPRNLDGMTQDDAVQVWWEPPLTAGTTYELLSVEPRTEFPNPNSEYSPMVQIVNVTSNGSSRDTWDLQASFPCGDASGEAGVESDGNYVYTTKWNAGSGTFFEYEMDGTFNGSFTVSGGAMDVRDLAYNDDDGLFYGSNAGNTLWGMDFVGGTVVNTISAPTPCRAIAYDNDNMGFWANNWDTDITLFDMSGAMQSSFAVGAMGSFYGFAYDYWTADGPFLWGMSQSGSGAEIVQMDLAASGAQIFNINVLPIVGATEIGGGLYTHCEAYADGLVTIGGICQNDVIFALELAECSNIIGPPQGTVPENLIGYKLYRDMNNIAYIPYNEEDTTYYWDFDLLPLCYQYDVSAIYDLTPYGFPGDTGESMYEGPFDICVEYGWPLPFVENWETGSFDPNLWTSGENWVVNGQIGNPEPSTEFKWDPILTNYKSSLTSYAIDGKYHPNTEDPYIDGDVWFDFDLQLDNVNATGAEMLYVEIWENGDWYPVTSFSNADGSFEWMNNHIDISNHAFGEIFRIRFTAEGAESSDILSWFIDNINIYRECKAPFNLTAEGIDPIEIDLNWSAPAGGGGSGGGEWITWDDGVNAGDGIGLTGGGVFSVASHWDADMITQYDGQYITNIRFYPYDNAITTAFTLKVWTGANAGTLVYEEALSGLVIGAWNDITLASPVMIDASQELWFGYTCDQPDGENPAGFDAGPGVVGYGDMITLDGAVWDPIASFGFDLNWNLQAFVAEMTDGPSAPMTYVDNTVYDNASPSLSVSGLNSEPTSVDALNTRALTGYNVYWNDDGAGYEFLEFTEDTFYAHIVVDPFVVNSLQCYYVEAVYEDCNAASNEACVVVTGIEDPELTDVISVYPNPARDILNITSSSDISHVTVMNYVGQVVYNQKVVEDNDLQLNVAGYETGVYMVKVETSAGIVVKKVTIAH